MKNCQHYSYDTSMFNLIENDAEYFTKNFLPIEDRVNWLNFHSMSDRSSISEICSKFGIDGGTIVRIFSKHKDYGLEEYENYMFFKLPTVDGTDITFLVMGNVVITIQEKSYKIFSLVRERITKRIGRIRIKGTAFLVFSLLYSMIDHYSEEVDKLEKEVILLESEESSDILVKVGELKRNLYDTKRRVSPVKSVVAQLEKIEEFVDMDDIRHFNELKHHATDVMDTVDECRQVLDGVVNLYYVKQGQYMNDIMKVLTLISTIFIPLTFIAGLYGMNFKYMPELNSPFGYPIAVFVMFVIAIALYRWFRGKGWLD